MVAPVIKLQSVSIHLFDGRVVDHAVEMAAS
jgi:hypothetical protein